jgi:hypothetical protein
VAILKNPTELWTRDCLVVAIETIELGGQILPLSYGQQTVKDRQITSSLFMQVAWARFYSGPAPTKADLQKAVATAQTLRRLEVSDLYEGEEPVSVFGLVEKILRTASKHRTLIVAHAVCPGLVALLDAVEQGRGVTLPTIDVVSTAVLERARQKGQPQGPHEKGCDFYRRIAAVGGELPDLTTCWNELEWNDLPVTPADRLFPVLATHLVYQRHLQRRLPGSA